MSLDSAHILEKMAQRKPLYLHVKLNQNVISYNILNLSFNFLRNRKVVLKRQASSLTDLDV